MPGAFVIHLHTGCGKLHLDLMLETGRSLATWRLAGTPEDLAAGRALSAERLADHRREYLTYEGPVSGERGEVSRLDGGTYRLIAAGTTAWTFELAGRQLKGRFTLRRAGRDEKSWVFTAE